MKKINTIAELEEEQKKLRMGLKVTKDAFSKSIGTNQKELKKYLLKRVALPVGAAGAGWLAYKAFKGNDHKPQKASASAGFIGGLIPIALNLVQTYFLKQQHDTLEEELPQSQTTTTKQTYSPNLKSVS